MTPEALRALEKKVLWLASWTIHHANHVRPKADGLKVAAGYSGNDEAAAELERHGITVVQDRCLLAEHRARANR